MQRGKSSLKKMNVSSSCSLPFGSSFRIGKSAGKNHPTNLATLLQNHRVIHHLQRVVTFGFPWNFLI
jgi:hypothetical protein